jgi:hypothetical protein
MGIPLFQLCTAETKSQFEETIGMFVGALEVRRGFVCLPEIGRSISDRIWFVFTFHERSPGRLSFLAASTGIQSLVITTCSILIVKKRMLVTPKT